MELDDLMTPRGHRLRAKIEGAEQEREKRLEVLSRDFYERLRHACDAFAEALAQTGYIEDKPPRSKSPSARPPPGRTQIPSDARVLKGIQPPLVWALFGACHNLGSVTDYFLGADKRPSARFSYGKSRIALPLTTPLPLELRNAGTKKEEVDAWVQGQAQAELGQLDTQTWDIVVWLFVTFFSQNGDKDASRPFDVWITDYFNWRGVAPSNRSAKRRREVVDRIRLLSTLHFYLDEALYQKVGGRQKKPLPQSGLFLKAQPLNDGECSDDGEAAAVDPVSFRVTLGEWAQPYIEVSAMLGIYNRRLSEYDQSRQKWERQIGWYLVSMMQAQGSRMKFKQTGEKVEVDPQQSLKMESILTGAGLNWKGMQKNDSGVIISQFLSALERLKADQIIGDYKCTKWPDDGSDLPVRGRLHGMLSRTYMIWPGPDMIQHLWAKAAAREEGQRRTVSRNRPVTENQTDSKGSGGNK